MDIEIHPAGSGTRYQGGFSACRGVPVGADERGIPRRSLGHIKSLS
jgi:hypothetical protein